MTIPNTQINYLSIAKDKNLGDSNTEAGKLWSDALDMLEQYDGFIRLYYGRSPEDPTMVQLHVVREHYSQHQEFEKTGQYTKLQGILSKLVVPQSTPFKRHAWIEEFTPNSKALGKGAAFDGTAIYIDTDDAWHVGSWPLWTHIVRHVDGCLGVTGGRVLEAVGDDKGKGTHHGCFVVYVGWESVEKHEIYHHTAHFANRRVVLALGNKGWKEYGHVVFSGGRTNANYKPQETQTSKGYRL